MASGQQSVRRCAVLGSPIEHSLSPALHRAAYDYLGLAWQYGRFEVDEGWPCPTSSVAWTPRGAVCR